MYAIRSYYAGNGARARMPMLGVVIPTLNEAGTVPGVLSDLAQLRPPTAVVVADGGSTDGTAAVAKRHGALVVSAPRGRGPQLV